MARAARPTRTSRYDPPMSDAAPHDDSASPGQTPRSTGLSAALVRRPITVFMLFLTLLGTGLLAYWRIPLTLLPRGLSSDSLTVSLPYPGAGPAEVEDQLTRLVEEELETIPGITELFSVSSEGNSRITVEFGTSTDMDVAYGEVRDRIERIRGRLPPEMDRYRIRRWNSNTDMPVMWMGLQYDADADDPFGPLERIVVPRLEGLDGVAQVNLMGIVDEAVRIFVDMDASRGYGVDLGEIIRTMQADNFTLPAGQIDDGGRTFALRIDARYRSMAEIESYPVGNGLVLSDIAEVVRARSYRDSVWRINGEAAAGLSVSRESDENTIDVCARVEDAIEELRADPRLEGVTFNIFFNQKETILDAIGGLQSSALWGGLFAVLVLGFFLRDLRLTLLAAIAIPASLLTGLACVYFGGQTLNLISLAGFTLGIGMLVDNAVVVVENIARRHRSGLDRVEAAARGSGEVGLAVLTATLTSMIVFLPLVFMDSGDRNSKVMLREVGLPISWSLAASLLVALVFLPTFTAQIMRGKRAAAAGATPENAGLLVRGYRVLLRAVLQHRFAGLLLFLGVLAAGAMTSGRLKASFSENDQMEGVTVGVDLPSTYTLSDANDVFRELEGWVEELKDELGIEDYSSRFDRRSGELTLYAAEDAPRAQIDMIPWIVRSRLPELPGVKLTVGWDQSGGKQLRINLRGPDFGVLAAIADDLADEFEALTYDDDGEQKPLLENVRTDLEQGLDEIHVSVDRDRSSELGVNTEMLRGMVSWGLGGQRLPDLQEGDREIRVQIEYAQNDAESLEFLRNLGLPTDTGAQVPLASVAYLDFDKSVGALVRRNGQTSTGVSGTPTLDNLGLVSRRVQAVLDEYPFPEGTSWSEDGGRREFEQDAGVLMSTLAFSVLLIYLLIAILLESITLPFSILVSVLLGLVGSIFALAATDRPMEPMVFVGMILLSGIVVNNAILLLDWVQRLRAQGAARTEALVQGGSDRLRPILMTAMTTIFGLMPMANPGMFPGESSQSGYESMAITVAGGLACSTVFTLFFVPLFYTWFDDLWQVLVKLAPFTTRRPRRAAAPGDAR